MFAVSIAVIGNVTNAEFENIVALWGNLKWVWACYGQPRLVIPVRAMPPSAFLAEDFAGDSCKPAWSNRLPTLV
jgi:hypothetical protein